MRVVVPGQRAAVGRVLVTAMDAIGLDATLYDYPPAQVEYHQYVGNAANRVQAGLEAWAVDYPEPSDLLVPLLRCADRTRSNNVDESLFCDPAVDTEMDRALSVQSRDQAAAGQLWAALDRTIADEAPWVPFSNGRQYDVVAARVRNYVHNPEYGLLPDQAWTQ